jgi:hypothetical protein
MSIIEGERGQSTQHFIFNGAHDYRYGGRTVIKFWLSKGVIYAGKSLHKDSTLTWKAM